MRFGALCACVRAHEVGLGSTLWAISSQPPSVSHRGWGFSSVGSALAWEAQGPGLGLQLQGEGEKCFPPVGSLNGKREAPGGRKVAHFPCASVSLAVILVRLLSASELKRLEKRGVSS